MNNADIFPSFPASGPEMLILLVILTFDPAIPTGTVVAILSAPPITTVPAVVCPVNVFDPP